MSDTGKIPLRIDDGGLTEVGVVGDLGRGEEIRSVRFVGDQAYVVTFRQIDPLFIIDLTDPRNPEVKGELEIPGFSTYLEPYGKDAVWAVASSLPLDFSHIAQGDWSDAKSFQAKIRSRGLSRPGGYAEAVVEIVTGP